MPSAEEALNIKAARRVVGSIFILGFYTLSVALQLSGPRLDGIFDLSAQTLGALFLISAVICTPFILYPCLFDRFPAWVYKFPPPVVMMFKDFLGAKYVLVSFFEGSNTAFPNRAAPTDCSRSASLVLPKYAAQAIYAIIRRKRMRELSLAEVGVVSGGLSTGTIEALEFGVTFAGALTGAFVAGIPLAVGAVAITAAYAGRYVIGHVYHVLSE